MIGKIAQSQAFGARRSRSVPGKGAKATILAQGQVQKEMAELKKALKTVKK